MAHDDGGSDLVDQGHQRVAVQFLLGVEILDLDSLRGAQRQHGGIVQLRAAGPLGVEFGLGPQIVFALLHIAGHGAAHIAHFRGAIGLLDQRRAPAPHLIDDIDRIALPHEILRPAFLAVERAHEIDAGAQAPMHHDDGGGMLAPGGDHVFHEHVAGHHGAPVDLGHLAANEEGAVFRQNKGLGGGGASAKEGGGGRSDACEGLEHGVLPMGSVAAALSLPVKWLAINGGVWEKSAGLAGRGAKRDHPASET